MVAIDTQSFIGEVSFQNFLLFIFVVVISIIIGNIARILLLRFLQSKTKNVFHKAIARIVMYSIYFVGFYFAFQRILDFNIPAFLAALGILGITMLLTMLPVMQNMFAGFVLSVDRPFKEGDIVEVSGTVCLVRDIMLRKTILRSLDGKLIIVPNIKFISESVTNYSKGEFIRVELSIDVKNDSSHESAVEIINKILLDDPNVLPHIPKKDLSIIDKIFVMPKNIAVLEPKIFIRSADKNKINLQIWFWIWDILRKEVIISNFYENILQEFRKAKIHLA